MQLYFINMEVIELICQKNLIYGICDYSVEDERLSMYAINEDIFDIWDETPLTDTEQTRYNNSKNYYNTAMNLLSTETDTIYKSKPIEDVPESLYAGELTENIKNASIAYYNSIRAGGGLLPAGKSAGAFKQAQAMAVLQSYRTNVLGLSIAHLPPKPDKVTTTFYNTAIGRGDVSRAENIAWKNEYEAENSAVWVYLNQLMDDSSENPFVAGHRTNILNPTNEDIGVGFAREICTMEIEHGNPNNFEMVAWPSNGVTLMENLDNTTFIWSTKFYSNYTVTKDTTVTVECLQNGYTWHWDKLSNGSAHYFSRDYESGPEELQNRVLFGDKNLIAMPDCTYKITLENLKNKNTGNTQSYTYRTTFKFADDTKYGKELDSIKIDTKDLVKVEGTTNKYYIPIDGSVDLDAIFSDDIVNKKVTWSCQGPSCGITQCGMVKVFRPITRTCKITLTHDLSGKSDSIFLQSYDPNQITLSSNKLDINVNDTKELSINGISGEVGNPTDIEWYVVKDSNLNKEYSIDDPEIQKYMEITKINDYKISIKGIDASPAECKFKIIVKLNGKAGSYKGEAEVNLHIPLEFLKFWFRDINTTGLSITNGASNEESSTEINMEDFYSKNNSYVIKFVARYEPKNTTVDQSVNWEVISGNGIITKTEEDGAFLINRPGEAKIKITSVAQPEISKVLKITITSDSTDWPQYTLGDVNEDGKINQRDARLVLMASTEQITLTENQKLAAEVTGDGKINQRDARKILEYAAELITDFPINN